jgi:hypothetical protein
MRLSLALAFVSFTILAPCSAAAAPLLIGGSGSAGSFTGAIEYQALSPTAAKLIISLTNTSPEDNGGYLTAFAFNNPLDLINDVVLSYSNDPDFKLIGGDEFDDSVATNPFGDSDIGASATKNEWLGGGSPTGGLAVGATGNFTFSFTGTALNTLTTESFMNALSTGGGGGAEWLLVRFRGFEDGDSDKVPARPVPEPTTLVLLGSGLAMTIVRHRMRRR